jgi:hypothetical protein
VSAKLDLAQERVAAAGVDARQTGEDRWRGDCVACGGADRMTFGLDLNGNVYFKCWSATCETQHILDALNLTWEDLRDDQDTAIAEGVVVLAQDVEVEAVEWLIDGRIPLGAITGLGGVPGDGKSALTALYAAEGSVGRHGDPWVTLFVSAEDSASRVIVPRLIALDADLSRVGFFSIRDELGTRVPTFPGDLAPLRTQVEATGARLVVLDPLNAFLDGDVDSHRDQQIRRVLAPQAQLAIDLHIAILVVLHTRKERGGPAIYRLGGSVGYGGAARSVLGLGRDPDDPEGPDGSRRVLGHVKCNWGPQMVTQIYRHEPAVIEVGDEPIPTHRLVYVGDSDLDAGAVFDGPKGDDRGADCEEAIADRLADGRRMAREVKTEVAAELGVIAKTVERAAMRMRNRGELIVDEDAIHGGKGGDRRVSWWEFPAAPDGDLQGRDSQGRDSLKPAPVPTLETPVNTGDSAPRSQGRDSREVKESLPWNEAANGAESDDRRARFEESLRRYQERHGRRD